MTLPAVSKSYRVWKSAQLCVGFHKDRDGRQRRTPRLWTPKDGRAALYSSNEQESFVLLKSTESDQQSDVQIRMRPDAIEMTRSYQGAWNAVTVDEFSVTVEVAGARINIGHDGTVTREDETGTTWLEANGGVLKKAETVEASISSDGMELTRRTPDNLSVIAEQGVLSRQR